MAEAVRIAGAGLAGLTAAYVLSKAGRPVDVYERKSRLLPSSGPHTEGIRNYRERDVLDELRSFGFDIPPFSTVQATIRCSPHARNVIRGPAHYLFMRGREEHTVDQILFERAKAAGAQFHFEEEIDASNVDIAATGPPPAGYNILGAGYSISENGSRLSRDTAYALFDNDVAPGGYFAITPGIGFHSLYSVSWSELDFDRLLARTEKAFDIPWIREIVGTGKRVGRILGRAYFAPEPISRAVRDGTLLAGEAGGFQDAVAGFGFRYSVITGGLAARSLLEGLDYRALLRDAFGLEFEHANAMREKMNKASNEDYDRMIGALGPDITLQEYIKRREARGF
ncbi:MAG: NAD(P)/FAD-dependent oxidoreductase [Methanobacteriota archaeon]|nr:MAG: NAD(P)/FAD-dependent oxidoreductase [Euryarchaeota archaeon]